jgi:hypothetical protein
VLVLTVVERDSLAATVQRAGAPRVRRAVEPHQIDRSSEDWRPLSGPACEVFGSPVLTGSMGRFGGAPYNGRGKRALEVPPRPQHEQPWRAVVLRSAEFLTEAAGRLTAAHRELAAADASTAASLANNQSDCTATEYSVRTYSFEGEPTASELSNNVDFLITIP